jgi:hypothetical protein
LMVDWADHEWKTDARSRSTLVNSSRFLPMMSPLHSRQCRESDRRRHGPVSPTERRRPSAAPTWNLL